MYFQLIHILQILIFCYPLSTAYPRQQITVYFMPPIASALHHMVRKF